MKTFFDAAVGTVTTKTVIVPDGADLATYIAQMGNGDTLSLAENGNYTLGVGTDGMTTLPNGYKNQHTKILGNNATITGGRDGLSLLKKSYIDFYSVKWVDQTRYCLTYDTCHHITQTNCTYTSTVGTDFLDTLKIFMSDDLTFTTCTILATTGSDTCDGFEFWGPCNRIVCNGCIVNQITGTVGTPDHHAFEVYGNAAGEECNDIQFINCQGNGCEVGFSCEGGAVGGISHTNIKALNCTATDSRNYDAQGIQGSTLYVTADTLTNRNGSVTEL